MQIHSPETKVGLFTLVAFFILLSLFFWLTRTKLFQSGYELEAVFDRIEDLRPGAPVKLHGVDVGRISRVYFEDYHIIVAMMIRPEFKIPKNTKAVISSAGIVGDKYLELVLVKPNEIPESKDNRIIGQNPYTMDQFYATAYEVIDSIKEIADSIKILTNEQNINHLKNSIARMDHITEDLEKLTGNPQIQELVQDATLAASELAQASLTANRFLTQLDAGGETAVQLKRTLAQAEKVTANLEKFTAILAKNGPELELLVKDARQTLQSINKAAQNINKVVEELTSGETTDFSQVKQKITAASEAAGKISEYVASFEKLHFQNNIGAGYNEDTQLVVDYRLDVDLNEKKKLLVGVEDIGKANLASFQWGIKSSNYLGRFGVFRNKVGVGMDYLPTQNLSFGIDLWDTKSTNLGLSSAYRFAGDWSVKFSADQNIDTSHRSLTLECWKRF